MGTDTSDPIGGRRPPAAPPLPKKKTISGPYQTYQIRVSVSTLAELQSLSPGVDGAPCFFRDNGQPWFWFVALPAGVVSSADGSTGATPSRPGGFWVALSALIPALFTVDAQTRYVSKSGSDTLGNGSLFRPFLTIQRALTSITDASSTKPYVVDVGPGTYTDAFLMIPWVSVKGSGRFATTLSPVQANWIAPAFSAAGTQFGSIENCAFGTNFVCDFNAIAAVGADSFLIQDIFLLGVGVTATGANVSSRFFLQNVEAQTSPVVSALTLNNLGTVINAAAFQGVLTVNGNDLYTTTHNIGSGRFSSITLTSTATVAANRVIANIVAECTASASVINVVGIFCAVTCPGRIRRVGADANSEFGFGGSVVPAGAGAIMLLDGGDNLIFANNSADRVYSVGRPGQNGTRIRLKNQAPFNIDFTFLGAAGTTGDATYVGPFGYIEMWLSDGTWMVDNPVQYGSTQLVNGVSPVIPADIAAQAVIQATLKTFSGAQGAIVAKASDRVVGTHAGGGSFRLTSIDPATGATVATDTGIYDWMVKRP